MPWFTVKVGTYERTINVAGDQMEAVQKVEAEIAAPIYCRLHDELPSKGRIEGEIGSMGYFYPRPYRATAVRPMCQPTNALLVYPAGDWVEP